MRTITTRIRMRNPSQVWSLTIFIRQLTTWIDTAVSQAELRELLAEEEMKQLDKGVRFPHKVTAAVFIRTALEIEENQ